MEYTDENPVKITAIDKNINIIHTYLIPKLKSECHYDFRILHDVFHPVEIIFLQKNVKLCRSNKVI